MLSEERLPSFPAVREVPLDPPSLYKTARQSPTPLIKAQLGSGGTTWLVLRYQDVRKVLSDARFSIVPTRPGFPMFSAGRAEFLKKERPTLNRFDPPEHTKLRRMLMREFMVTRLEEKRPFINQLVVDLLMKMKEAGPPADIVEGLANPLPTLVISDMLGMPYEDHSFIQEKTKLKLSVSAEPGRQTPYEAQLELIAYIDKMLRERMDSPDRTDDVFGRLIAEQVRPGHLSIDDAVALAELLVVAGHETTGNMISMGTMLLLQHPDQLALLRSDPSLVPQAIEEMLRYLSVVHLHCARVALEDVEIGGQLIRAGDGVFAMINSANRDESVFPNPDRFDIKNGGTQHVAFGFGIHQCLGQTLARIELESVFRNIFEIFPTLRFAEEKDEIDYKLDSFVIGLNRLPVAW